MGMIEMMDYDAPAPVIPAEAGIHTLVNHDGNDF